MQGFMVSLNLWRQYALPTVQIIKKNIICKYRFESFLGKQIPRNVF